MFPEPVFISTSRLKQAVRLPNPSETDKPVLLLVHGNASDSSIWQYITDDLSKHFRLIIPDLRGYGQTEETPLPATEGVKIWVDDLLELMDALNISTFSVCGHSLGGVVCMGMVALVPTRLKRVILLSPGSPFGYGGTKDAIGTPCYDDFSGSGAGLIHPEFLKRVVLKDRSVEQPSTAPAAVIKRLFFSDSFHCSEAVLDTLLTGLFRMKIGDQKYPGDIQSSDNWPFFAPGKYGATNAISPKYNQWISQNIEKLPLETRPALSWIHGTDDKLVSNAALSDAGTLGKLGLIPQWPGTEIYPPQPMLDQLTLFLKNYHPNTPPPQIHLINKVGHCPQIENPNQTAKLIIGS